MPNNSLTVIQATVLSIVQDSEPIYGLSIGHVYKQRTDDPILVGSLYRSLKYLREKGYIRDRWEKRGTKHQGPKRRYYTITEKGISALKEYRKHVELMLKALGLSTKASR